jgi:hypothetical protein
MRSLRLLLPAVDIVFFALVAVGFIGAHGGLHGDVGISGPGTDTVSGPIDKGLVMFNRWQFSGDQESLLTRAFLTVNVAGFGVARLFLAGVGTVTEEFRTTYPLGLSYASYSLILGMPLSLLQWFGIGLGLDFVRRRRDDPRTAQP